MDDAAAGWGERTDSVVPVVGSVMGAVVGSVVGPVVGSVVGEKRAQRFCRWAQWGLPKEMGHVNMTVSLETDTLGFEQRALATPAWSRAACDGDHTVAGQLLGLGGVAQGAAHEAWVAGPSGECGDDAVGGDAPTGNLADDVEDIVAERAGLLGRHAVGVVSHHVFVRI